MFDFTIRVRKYKILLTQNLALCLHSSETVEKLEMRLMTKTTMIVPAIELTLLTFILMG